MNNFEISDSFVGITQIWEVFFSPIVSTMIVFLFIYFLVGKQYIHNTYRKYKFIEIDNKHYRQKYIKINEDHLNGNNNVGILLPLSEVSEKIITVIQNPIVFVMILLLLVYTIDKTINLCSFLYPIKYSFNGASLLLYSTPKEIIAEIWTYFPEYSLESLYQKISILGEESSYAKYADDYNAIYMFSSISKFCSILCIINFFIHKPKIRIYLRTICLFFACLCVVIFSEHLQFQKDAKVLEQKAYYVEQQLVLDKPSVPTDFNTYQLAVKKVENELRYVEDIIFYGSFGIDFGF